MARRELMNLEEMPELTLHIIGRERHPTSLLRPVRPACLHNGRAALRTDGSGR